MSEKVTAMIEEIKGLTVLEPITGLAVVLKQIAEKNGAPAEEAAAEAPAAE